MACSIKPIPDFSQPLHHPAEDAFTPPRRVAFMPELAMGYGPEHHADARLSGARRSVPNTPGMGTLSPRDRDQLLMRLEAFADAPGEPARYAENTVQADLVSAFRDGDRHYLLVVPAGGKPVRIDVTGRIGAVLAFAGALVEQAGL
jgi:hypothetical protein